MGASCCIPKKEAIEELVIDSPQPYRGMNANGNGNDLYRDHSLPSTYSQNNERSTDAGPGRQPSSPSRASSSSTWQISPDRRNRLPEEQADLQLTALESGSLYGSSCPYGSNSMRVAVGGSLPPLNREPSRQLSSRGSERRSNSMAAARRLFGSPSNSLLDTVRNSTGSRRSRSSSSRRGSARGFEQDDRGLREQHAMGLMSRESSPNVHYNIGLDSMFDSGSGGGREHGSRRSSRQHSQQDGSRSRSHRFRGEDSSWAYSGLFTGDPERLMRSGSSSSSSSNASAGRRDSSGGGRSSRMTGPGSPTSGSLRHRHMGGGGGGGRNGRHNGGSGGAGSWGDEMSNETRAFRELALHLYDEEIFRNARDGAGLSALGEEFLRQIREGMEAETEDPFGEREREREMALRSKLEGGMEDNMSNIGGNDAAMSSALRCALCTRVLIAPSPTGSPYGYDVEATPVVAVLACGHVFHPDCLSRVTSKEDTADPPCPLCRGKGAKCQSAKCQH